MTTLPGQTVFDFTTPVPGDDGLDREGLAKGTSTDVEPCHQSSSSLWRKGLVQQVARDLAVLREDPVYHVPSREFYEQRIALYRKVIQDA